MKFKRGKIIFEPDDKERIEKEAEQIQQFNKELQQAASGWVSTKKHKLAIKADKSQTRENEELDELYDIFRDNIMLTDRWAEAANRVQDAARALSKALRTLNTVNAQLDRGPADIEDILLHNCVSQASLNKYYAEENTRYYAELAKKQQNNHADERQK